MNEYLKKRFSKALICLIVVSIVLGANLTPGIDAARAINLSISQKDNAEEQNRISTDLPDQEAEPQTKRRLFKTAKEEKDPAQENSILSKAKEVKPNEEKDQPNQEEEALSDGRDVIIPLLRVNYNVTQNDITGPFDIGAIAGFNKDLDQNIYYSAQNSWQRMFGYGEFYDKAAPYVNMHFDSLCFYFNYGGKDWLIEAWKGQYGITTGGEVGVYYKNENSNRKNFRAVSNADKLPISITLYHNGQKMFHRPMETTWWQTGFRLFKTYRSNVLGMEFSIKFKDKAMLNAFRGSITKDMNISYSTKGTTINVAWDMK